MCAHRPPYHGSFSAQVENSTTDRSATRKICAAYSTIDYKMDDDVNDSIVCLGVIGVNAETLKRAQVVNTAKTKFKELCTPLQGIRFRIPVKGEISPTLIYATGRRAEAPEVHFPVDIESEDKPQRIRQSKLEPEGFLRSLPVYRYIA